MSTTSFLSFTQRAQKNFVRFSQPSKKGDGRILQENHRKIKKKKRGKKSDMMQIFCIKCKQYFTKTPLFCVILAQRNGKNCAETVQHIRGWELLFYPTEKKKEKQSGTRTIIRLEDVHFLQLLYIHSIGIFQDRNASLCDITNGSFLSFLK
jgi:hypothetical protein